LFDEVALLPTDDQAPLVPNQAIAPALDRRPRPTSRCSLSTRYVRPPPPSRSAG